MNRGAPVWLAALQMAEAWGVPPWVIMEQPGGIAWASRWVAYRKQVRWVEEQHNKSKQ